MRKSKKTKVKLAGSTRPSEVKSLKNNRLYKRSPGALVVEEACQKYPNTPDLTLAKLLYKENPTLFKSLEATRSKVRQVRGHCGEAHRSWTTRDKSLFKPITNNTNPFAYIPDEHNEIAEKWTLPRAYSKVLLIGDIHFPYHDTQALKTCLAYAKAQKVDSIYIHGDLLDFYALSFHEKDARKRPGLGEELEMGRAFLKGLRKDFDGCAIWFKPANHEYRLERYLAVKAPELLDTDVWRLDVLLRLGESGVNYIHRRAKSYFGKLLVEHGDRIKGAGGVNPARTLYLKYKRHAICGHFHRKSVNTANIYDGQCIQTHSIGCLCNLEPEYMEVNEWNHGFAIIDVDHSTGNFIVNNHTIIDGEVF